MPASQINSDSKMEALEIEDEVLAAIVDAGPDGLSYQDGCEIVGMGYDRFYLLIQQLVSLGRLKVERGKLGNQNRIFLPYQEAPSISALTDKQKEVLELLCSKMDDERYISISYNQISRLTSCRCPAFAIERLDYKGFLAVLESGRGAWSNLYRIYPEQNGPRGYSWPRPEARPSEH